MAARSADAIEASLLANRTGGIPSGFTSKLAPKAGHQQWLAYAGHGMVSIRQSEWPGMGRVNPIQDIPFPAGNGG
jgi:hypothetical protein